MCHTDCSLRIKLHHHVGGLVHLSEKLVVSVGSQVSHLSILGPQWDGTPQAGADTILHCPEQTHLSSPLSNPIVGPKDLYDFSTGTTTYVNCPLLLCRLLERLSWSDQIWGTFKLQNDIIMTWDISSKNLCLQQFVVETVGQFMIRTLDFCRDIAMFNNYRVICLATSKF